MPFDICNAPTTFQRCTISIFSNMIENSIEVFINDFFVLGDTFDSCLDHVNTILKRFFETILVLNWEELHFMATECIILGHKISSKGIEVD